jgi:hypothetical protein
MPSIPSKSGKNFFLDKTVSTNPVKVIEIDDPHMEAKDYICANPLAIYGSQPRSVDECLNNFFPGWTVDAGITLQLVAKLRPSKKTGSGVDLQTGNPTGMDFWEEIPEPDGCSLTCEYIQTKLCDSIANKLDESFLGCFYQEPNAPFSCDCPNFGKNFPKLLNVALVNSTFWNTPYDAPLYRAALSSWLNSKKAEITVHGSFKVKPGSLIGIIDSPASYAVKNGQLHGIWLVTNISHKIFKDRHHEMALTISKIPSTEAPFNTKITNMSYINTIER